MTNTITKPISNVVTKPTNTNFIYFLVADGNNKLLKEEIKRKYPKLMFAYSREHFITFKNSDYNFGINTGLDIVFAYSYGLSAGKSNGEKLQETLRIQVENFSKDKKFILNSFLCEDKFNELQNAFGEQIIQGVENYKASDIVFEIIKTHDDEYYVGVHTYGFFKTNLNDYKQEPNTPSRAYYKAKEAISLSERKLEKDDIILELGSAPGGTTYYFLQKGLKVTGIDNAQMSEICANDKNFVHVRYPVEHVQKVDIGEVPYTLMFVDINVDPQFVMYEVERLFGMVNSKFKALYFTMKLTHKFTPDKIPYMIERAQRLGFKKVYTKQIPSNKSEFLMYATND